MRLYYRISDAGYTKPKVPGATKEVCLMNFIKAFSSVIFPAGEPDDSDTPPLRIIADRCNRPTVKMLTETGIPVTLTDRGNAGSLIDTLKLAVEEAEDDEVVYFCEDDYLHLASAPKLLEEGLRRSDYVTLYDHPDKYTRFYNGGEFSKVIKTASSHWRFTASTCMTFGATVKTLKADMDVWEHYTQQDHPHDHYIFTDIGKRGRRLAVCIPGVACHTDLTFSGEVNQILIDPWAIDLMIGELQRQIDDYEHATCFIADHEHMDWLQLKSSVLKDKDGWQRLIALDALLTQAPLKAKE